MKNIQNVIRKVPESFSVIVGGYSRVVNKKNSEHIPSKKCVKLQLVTELGLWRIIMKTQEFGDLRFPEIRMAEDQVYFVMTKILERKLFVTDEILYYYNVNQEETLTSEISNITDINIAIELIKRLLMEQNNYSIYYVLILIKLIYSLLKRDHRAFKLVNLIFLAQVVHHFLMNKISLKEIR